MQETPASRPPNEPAWFALRTQPRKERLAIDVLTNREEIEIFCPFLTRKKKTRVKGWHVATEPFFPGYLFARFKLAADWRRVTHAHGITGIVRFKEHIPVIPDTVIEELRSMLPDSGPDPAAGHPPPETFHPGERVEITEGPLAGMTAEVLHGMTRKQRVELLLDFLGSRAEIHPDALVHRRDDP